MIEAEQGIPMPPVKNARGTSKYPLHTMDVGESFLVPVSNPKMRERYQIAVMRAVHHVKYTGKRFTSRQVENGVRVWRVK